MKQQCKAEISVFLSLIFLMILSVILGLLESARMQAARANTLVNTETGLFSVFGEYDKDLLEMYDIFMLDGSYGTGTFQTELVKGRIQQFMEKDQGNKTIGKYRQSKVEEVHIEALETAVDHGNKLFVEQAADWIKGEVIIDLLTDQQENIGRNGFLEGEMLLSKTSSISDQIEQIREAAKTQAKASAENGEDKNQNKVSLTEYEFENPITKLKELMDKGIIGLVLPGADLSKSALKAETCLSGREKNTGFGTFAWGESIKTTDRLLFQAYLQNKLPCYTDLKSYKPQCMQYQWEYVIAGKESDQENLKSVLERLLALRFALNYAAILRSEKKTAEAAAYATAISAACGLPVLEELLKQAFLLLWSFEDSIEDLKRLCNNEKVPLFDKEGEKNDTGIDYKGYLMILMSVLSNSTKTDRGLDMIEHTIRIEKERQDFKLDHMIGAIKITTTYKLQPLFAIQKWNGAQFETSGMYCY